MTADSTPATTFQISVNDYDPVTDGTALTTKAVQEAINDCATNGGGEVYVPAGEYLVGTVELRDDVTLRLAGGAVLKSSRDAADLGTANLGKHVVGAHGASNIGLVGRGRVKASGDAFREPGDHYGFGDLPSRNPEDDYSSYHPDSFGYPPQLEYTPSERGNAVQFDHCSDVKIKDVRIENPAAWTLNFRGCDRVSVQGITIRTAIHGPNADGINIAGCQNVRISDCDIVASDDAVVLKNFDGEVDWLPRTTRNVAISNCLLATTCNAFKIGTETVADFENITLTNLTISSFSDHPEYEVPARYEGADGPISGIALEMVDGANLRNVTISNVSMRGARAPIFIRLGNRGGRDGTASAKAGSISDIIMSDIVATGASITSSITGIPEASVENVSLRDIRITTHSGRQQVLDGSDHPGDTGDHAPIERPIDADVAFTDVPELDAVYPEANMWGPLPAHGIYCRHVDDLDIQSVCIECEQTDYRPVLVCDDVIDLSIRGLSSNATAGEAPLIDLRNVQTALLQGIQTPESRSTGIGVSGENSQRITITGNDLICALNAVDVGESVAGEAVETFANRTLGP